MFAGLVAQSYPRKFCNHKKHEYADGMHAFWMGLNMSDYKNPSWVDGTPVDYTNWHPAQPSVVDPRKQKQDCGQLLYRCEPKK